MRKIKLIFIILIGLAFSFTALSNQLDPSSVYNSTKESVVELYVSGEGLISKEPFIYKASGVCIDKSGFIVTSGHFFWGEDRSDPLEIKKLQIEMSRENGRPIFLNLGDLDASFEPNPIISEHSDLAIIKVDGEELPSSLLGNLDQVEVLDQVMALGYPGDTYKPIATLGRIAGRGIYVQGEKMIMANLSVAHGMSGGPLVNMAGEVIGIIVAIPRMKLDCQSANGGEFNCKGEPTSRFAYAISINQAKALYKKMKSEKG